MSTPHPNPGSKAVIEQDPSNPSRVTVTIPDKPGHLIFTTTLEGQGERPVTGKRVSMAYTGWVKDVSRESGRAEKPFDSSVGRGDFDVTIGVGQVITGWDEGVTLMRQGGKAILEISPYVVSLCRVLLPALENDG